MSDIAKNGNAKLNNRHFVRIAPPRRRRGYIEIFNTSRMSDVSINLCEAKDAIDGTGIMIRAGKSWRLQGDCYSGEISGIASNGHITVTFSEY